jgi:hypothetical protein
MFFTILLLTVGLVPDDWYTFETESKAFRAALPTRPDSTTSRSVAGPSGPIQLTTARVQAADGVYSVQITENSARVNPNTLDDGIRQFAASKKATLGPLRPVTVDGNPGREFEMTEGPKRSKVRFVASGGMLIVLSAAGLSGAGVPSAADRFLGSLEIGAVDVAGAEAKARARADSAELEDKAKAKMEAEIAKAKMEAEIAKAKMETEIAKAKMETEVAKAKAEAEIARSRANSATAKGKAEAEFADKPDASMVVAEADKGDDDSKDPDKPAAKKSNAPIKVTIGRMPKNAKPYADPDIENLSRSFTRDRDGFRDLGPEGSVLVGVSVTYIERFGGPKVRSVQPIYRSDKNHYPGLTYGEAVGPVFTVVARPGYAVGGLVTHTGLTVDGFGIVFMKIDGDRLDPNDSYNSPWIGDRKGGSPGEVMSRGGLVVGLQGRAKNEVNAIGLTAKK